MLGYLAGPRVGAAAYNAAHTQLGPLALGALALGAGPPSLLLGGLIWAAHIGLDRALGYGLKHASGFHHTHLGPSHAHAHARARRRTVGCATPNDRAAALRLPPSITARKVSWSAQLGA